MNIYLKFNRNGIAVSFILTSGCGCNTALVVTMATATIIEQSYE